MRRRALLLALATAAAAAGLSAGAIGLRTDNGIDVWLPADDADRVAYERFREDFGGDGLVIAAGLDRPVGELAGDLAAFARDAAAMPGVERTIAPVADVGGTPRLATDRPESSFLLREEGAGAASAAVAVLLAPHLDAPSRARLVDDLEARAKAAPHGGLLVAGPPVLNRALDVAARRSFGRLVPFAALGVTVVLLLGLRSLGAALAIVAGAGLASGATMGLLGLAGRSMNMALSVVPALTLVLGTAYALHPVSRFLDTPPGPGEPKTDLWRRARRATFRPALVAAVTTAAGLLSLLFTDLPPLRDLGRFGAAGVMISFALAYSFVPAALTAAGLRPRSEASPPIGAVFALARMLRHRRAIGVGAVAVAAIAAVGAARLTVESNILRLLDPDSPALVASREIQARLTGLTPVEVVLSGPERDVMSAATADAAAGIRALPRVTGVLSPVLDARWGEALGAGAAPAVLAGMFPRFVHLDGDRAAVRLTVHSLIGSSRQGLDLMRAIRAAVAGTLPGGVRTEVTGAIPLLARVQTTLVTSQIRSFAAAFVLVSLLLLVDLRRPRVAALALVPNLFPVLLAAGAMGWLGIPLDAATIAVAGIAFGMAVDDTVHLVHRWEALGGDVRSVLAETLRPVLLTTLAAIGGFAAFAASPFPPARRLGLLVAGAAAVAVAADLVVLPVLLPRRRNP